MKGWFPFFVMTILTGTAMSCFAVFALTGCGLGPFEGTMPAAGNYAQSQGAYLSPKIESVNAFPNGTFNWPTIKVELRTSWNAYGIEDELTWSKLSGPSTVSFSGSDTEQSSDFNLTTATFIAPGSYSLEVKVRTGNGSDSRTLDISIADPYHLYSGSGGTSSGSANIQDSSISGRNGFEVSGSINIEPNSGPEGTPATVTITFAGGADLVTSIQFWQKTATSSGCSEWIRTPAFDPTKENATVWRSHVTLTGNRGKASYEAMGSDGRTVGLGVVLINGGC